MLTHAAQGPDTILAGAAQADITPQADIHLAGDVGKFRPAIYVADPLYARVLVLRSGSRKLCIVSLDLTIITREFTDRIRRAAAERGFEPDAVMVHVTQTHTAPSLGDFMFDESFGPTPPDMAWLRGGDPRYADFALPRILEAVARADEDLVPVRITAGAGVEGRLAFNRRAIDKQGRAVMPGPRWQPPLGPTYIRHMEGPVDPEVGVVWLQAPDLRMKAALLHYTCHPVNVFPRRVVSADWPGAWAAAVQRALGPDCVPVVLNGCCGDVNPWDPFDPDYRPDGGRMGSALAATTLAVLEHARPVEGTAIDWRVKRLRLPLREVEPDLLEASRQMLAAHPQPLPSADDPDRVDWEWMKAASIVSVALHAERQADLEYEIQALRVGDIAVVGLPGEPFAVGQLHIKSASPASLTLVAHCTSHYVGYVPTRDAYARGGHECETRYWSKLAPGALERIVDEAGALLGDLF